MLSRPAPQVPCPPVVVAAPPSRTQDLIEQVSLDLSGRERVYTRHEQQRERQQELG